MEFSLAIITNCVRSLYCLQDTPKRRADCALPRGGGGQHHRWCRNGRSRHPHKSRLSGQENLQRSDKCGGRHTAHGSVRTRVTTVTQTGGASGAQKSSQVITQRVRGAFPSVSCTGMSQATKARVKGLQQRNGAYASRGVPCWLIGHRGRDARGGARQTLSTELYHSPLDSVLRCTRLGLQSQSADLSLPPLPSPTKGTPGMSAPPPPLHAFTGVAGQKRVRQVRMARPGRHPTATHPGALRNVSAGVRSWPDPGVAGSTMEQGKGQKWHKNKLKQLFRSFPY